MPELGRYAVQVLVAYGVTIVALGGLVAVSVARWRRLRAQVRKEESRG